MSEQNNEILAGPGSGGGGGASSGVVGAVALAVINSEAELNTNFPATDPQYAQDGIIAIVGSSTERKIFFTKNQTWLWSEEFTNDKIDALEILVNDLKSGIKRLGTFDPKTNTPALPSTPLNADYDAGDYYEIIGLALGEEFTWNGLVLTNGDWVITEKDNSNIVLKWNKRNFGILAKDIYFDNTTSGLQGTNLQSATDEITARLKVVENRSTGSGNAGEKYYISAPATAGVYKASKDFTTTSPATIALTLTNTYQTAFEAETDPLNTTILQSGDWNFDFDFTHDIDKDFDVKVSFYDNTTLLDSVEQNILAGGEKLLLQKTFDQFTFTQNNKLKFKVELKSTHGQVITFYTNNQDKNLHIHTPIVIDTVNSAVQTALNLKQNITDNTLNTTSKTIVGAVNELKTSLDSTVVSNETTTVDNDFIVFSGTSGKVVKKTSLENYKTLLNLAKNDVGLSNVDNTSDANKPISTATQNALDNKEPTLTKGNLTEATSSVLTITNGNNAVIGAGTSIEVKQATSTQNGFLNQTDWNTFNNKQNTTDNTLNTTSKTIPGSINEIRDRANQIGTQQASTVAQATITPTNTGIADNDTQDVINNKLQGQINVKANDNAVVHLAGTETITGNKDFSGTVTLSNLTASQRAELDASKNLISVAKNTADNKNYSTTATDIKMNGTQSLGSLDTLARADHVHPSDTTKANTTDFRQESTLFVEQTYGLDTNAGTTPNKPFKTIAKAWTDINSSGQVKVMGSATYNETHTFANDKTSIKTTLDQGSKITGAIDLVTGNTSMYFSGGMFGATLNDGSAGTTYFENVNVGGAIFNFSNGGHKVIRGSSSAPSKINLTGVAGTLYLENISGASVSIDIGTGWIVFINGVQLNIGVRLGTVVEGILISATIDNQPTLDVLALTPNANGYYVLNFGSQATPPVIKDSNGQVILTFEEGAVIYKAGTTHQLMYSIQSAPSALSLLTGVNQATTLAKNNTRWVRFDTINTNITNIQTQVNGRSNIIIVNSEAERKALTFGTGLRQVGNGTLVLQKNGGGATPFVFNGGDSQDVTANANWITANTNAIPAIKPTARILIFSGQSNTSGYAVLDTDYLDDSPNVSDNVDVMASRCLLSNSAEDTGLFYAVNVTANGTNRVTIANTNYVYKFKKGQRVTGTNVPANTYIDVADVNNDFTTLQFGNVIPNTVTSMNFSRIEGEPIKLQAFNNSNRRTMPAYRIGNANGSGVAYFFAKGNIDQNFQENSNDVVCIICAINGSTGFANNGAWVAGTGYLAQETIRLYAAAKEYYEPQGFNVTLTGGIFCLGEEDSRQGTTTTAMQTFLQDLITYYKNNCPSTAGFTTKAPIWLFNGLHSYWLNSTLGYSRAEVIPLNQKVAVDNAFRNMSQLVEGATYVAFPTQNKDYTQADCIHVTVPAVKKQAKRLINALQKARQNTVDSPSEAPENLTVNGVQETGALATWSALFGQKYDLEWKFSNQDWALATRVNDLTTASYSVPADSGRIIDVRVLAKKQNGSGISPWSTVNGTTVNSTIQNQMTVRFTAGINSDANFTLTDSLGNLNATLQTGARHISRWLNEVTGQRHAESLIMGTCGVTTTITLTAGSNIATLASATGVTANTLNKTYVDIVSTVVNGVKHSDYSILPRDTLITAINGTQITMSNPAPAVVDAGGYNVRLRYNRTLNQAGNNLTQVGGNRQGHPVRSKILNNKNEWLHCLNLQSENNGLIVDDLLDGNFSYSGTVLFRHTAYNTLAAVPNSDLTLIVNTTAYGGNVALDTGSRNYLSRIVEQNLGKLSTLWRTNSVRVTANHNTISGGASDTADILVDKWYMFTVTFDRVAGLIKLYRNGVFVVQLTNTTALTAFQGYIGCIDLSNGFRAGSVGTNYAAVYYHKRELAATEVASLRTFLTNKFSITLG